jgi:hypothetical protein
MAIAAESVHSGNSKGADARKGFYGPWGRPVYDVATQRAVLPPVARRVESWMERCGPPRKTDRLLTS